jgi:hypothetical protein
MTSSFIPSDTHLQIGAPSLESSENPSARRRLDNPFTADSRNAKFAV